VTLRAGHLYMNTGLYHEGAAKRLETLWGWWCAAAVHGERAGKIDREALLLHHASPERRTLT
jgi:hypothetical protein